MFQDQDFIRRVDLAAEWKVSLATIDRWSRIDPLFPRKIKINSRVVGYRKSLAEAWRKNKFKSN